MGFMSKKAKNLSFSAILYDGISPFTILVNMVDIKEVESSAIKILGSKL